MAVIVPPGLAGSALPTLPNYEWRSDEILAFVQQPLTQLSQTNGDIVLICDDYIKGSKAHSTAPKNCPLPPIDKQILTPLDASSILADYIELSRAAKKLTAAGHPIKEQTDKALSIIDKLMNLTAPLDLMTYSAVAFIAYKPLSADVYLAASHALLTNQMHNNAPNVDSGRLCATTVALLNSFDPRPEIRSVAFEHLMILDPKFAKLRAISKDELYNDSTEQHIRQLNEKYLVRFKVGDDNSDERNQYIIPQNTQEFSGDICLFYKGTQNLMKFLSAKILTLGFAYKPDRLEALRPILFGICLQTNILDLKLMAAGSLYWHDVQGHSRNISEFKTALIRVLEYQKRKTQQEGSFNLHAYQLNKVLEDIKLYKPK